MAFIDNRPKTPKPILFAESILPGKSQASGWVGVINPDGTIIPEKNSYIYIYIQGFLINPPELLPNGDYKNPQSVILTDNDGYWSTNKFFFNVFPPFQSGQSFAVKAKSKYKTLSDQSFPIIIGGTATPIDLGVIGEFGKLRAPYQGETSITGRISYWNDRNGNPVLNFKNHVSVYIDGIKKGDIPYNEIRGNNASFPITENITSNFLSLKVDNEIVSVPLSGFLSDDKVTLIGEQDGINTSFDFTLEDINTNIRVFLGGLRQADGVDYVFSYNPSLKLGNINFFNPPPTNLVLQVIYQFESEQIIFGERPAGNIDSTNNVFTLQYPPKIGTLQLFLNGIMLNLYNQYDYTLSSNEITLNTRFTPEPGDIFLADYQPVTSSSNLFFYTVPSIRLLNNPGQYSFNIPDGILGRPHIFLNGALQEEGINKDYTFIGKNIVQFTPWQIPSLNSDIQMIYAVTPIILTQLIKYLNSTDAFEKYALVAEKQNLDSTFTNVLDISGLKDGINTFFEIPLDANIANILVYMGGLRQKEGPKVDLTNDYIIDYESNVISFNHVITILDTIVAEFYYKSTNVIFGEIPFGDKNGVNKIFELSSSPKPNTVAVYFNGLRLFPFSGWEYSVVGNKVVFNNLVPNQNDTIIVDYEKSSSASTLLVYKQITNGIIDGVNKTFSFDDLSGSYIRHVYLNGSQQVLNKDYIFNKSSNSATCNIVFNIAPNIGDKIHVDLLSSELITDNPFDQIKIVSPYPIEPDYTQNNVNLAVFGPSPVLFPGKKEDDSFKYYINPKTGNWKWTWWDANTNTYTPFKKLQHIQARCLNDEPLRYRSMV